MGRYGTARPAKARQNKAKSDRMGLDETLGIFDDEVAGPVSVRRGADQRDCLDPFEDRTYLRVGIGDRIGPGHRRLASRGGSHGKAGGARRNPLCAPRRGRITAGFRRDHPVSPFAWSSCAQAAQAVHKQGIIETQQGFTSAVTGSMPLAADARDPAGGPGRNHRLLTARRSVGGKPLPGCRYNLQI
jgi:hypothetical protein